MFRHRGASLAAFTASAALLVLGTFLPWLRTGSTSRSSYDLLGLLDRLQLAPDGMVSTLISWWPIVPLLVTLAVVAAWWELRWVAFVAAVVAVGYAGGVGITLVVASRRNGIGIGSGPWVCAASSIVFLVTAGWIVFTHSSDRVARTPHAVPPAGPS